ncbi:MAG: glycosyltransferase family 4 protein [Prochloraceae cyanobacterium]|nr:glycosyltransferase family 4 protein [Prochloraceae cyanobacterium]
MKIAYILPKLKDSGIIRIPFWLSKRFSPSNDIKIFYFGETKPGEKSLEFEVPVEKISFTNFCHDLNNYDIVHSHGIQPDVYVLLNKSKIHAIKLTTIHGYHLEELRYYKGIIFSFIFGKLWDFACQKFDVSVCISKTMERYYKNKGFTNTRVIYNGIIQPNINDSTCLTDTSRKSNEIWISTVSILNRRKGVEQIIKLLTLNERFHLTAIGGSGKDISRLQRIAERLGVASRCIFTGYKENPWKIAINSDVFIFPSRSEGFGLALIEAASLEIPIICSDIPTFREIFAEDEVTFFQLDNIHDLNEKLLKTDEIRAKKKKAKLKVQKEFDLESMCLNYYRLYLGVLR